MKRVICDVCKTQCDCGKCRTKEPEKYKCDLDNGICETMNIFKYEACRAFRFDLGKLCLLEDKAYWEGRTDSMIRRL